MCEDCEKAKKAAKFEGKLWVKCSCGEKWVFSKKKDDFILAPRAKRKPHRPPNKSNASYSVCRRRHPAGLRAHVTAF